MLFGKLDKYFFVHGSAEGPSRLNSFDNALLASGIGNTNLVRLSSIIPPGAEEISAPTLPYGSLVPIAYTCETSDVAGELIAAAIAIGMPKEKDKPGIIMEHHIKGSAEECEEMARQFVRHAFEKRAYETKEIKSVSAQTIVTNIATAFAGVVLWT